MDMEILKKLYGSEKAAIARKTQLTELENEFEQRFGSLESSVMVSAPGRTEIVGNHTDHNLGCVMAASVDLDTVAVAAPTGDSKVTLYSKGYKKPFIVDISRLDSIPEEKETTLSLIRGVAAGLKNKGYNVGGFNACVASNVQRGSGLSSSAAFEVMLVKLFDVLFNGETVPAELNARISQWAENNYFLKPSGLMDQMASAVGGLVYIDFAGGGARTEAIKYDFSKKGLNVCVVSAGGDHGNLTAEYAAIPAEMKQAAKALGGSVLSEVEDKIEDGIPLLKGKVPDRAILRALHFKDENERVRKMAEALKNDDIRAFLDGIIESGESSWKLLQNLCVPGHDNQEMLLALELSRRMLKDDGAWRIHGGGFAGTILAFVPDEKLSAYIERMESVFGKGCAKPLFIRPDGAVRIR